MKCQFHLRSTLLPLTHICNFVATDWLALLLLAKSLRLPFSFQLEHYFNVSVCLFICLSPNHPLNTHPLTHSPTLPPLLSNFQPCYSFRWPTRRNAARRSSPSAPNHLICCIYRRTSRLDRPRRRNWTNFVSKWLHE